MSNWFFEHPYLTFILAVFVISVINNLGTSFLALFKKEKQEGPVELKINVPEEVLINTDPASDDVVH